MKYYCICSYGEGDAFSVVALTDKEHEVLKEVFARSNAHTIKFDDYAASVVLYDKGFETREEAIEYGYGVYNDYFNFNENKKELLLFNEGKEK